MEKLDSNNQKEKIESKCKEEEKSRKEICLDVINDPYSTLYFLI